MNRAKPIEDWILETLNHYGFKYNDKKIKNWEKCSHKEDKSLKRDVKAHVGETTYYGQLKFRQPNSGTDIGCALIQPYPGLKSVRELYDNKDDLNFILARDYKFDGIVYVCLNNTWDKLMILPYNETIKPMYMAVLEEWLESDVNLGKWNRTFRSKTHSGAELKWKCDSGRGWDAKAEKILCYLPISLFEDDNRVSVVEMLEPPECVETDYSFATGYFKK